MFHYADLLQPAFTRGLLLDLITPDDSGFRGPTTFTECPGPHEEVYDIDLDDCYTEPDDVKKGGDVTLIVWGVMTEDVFVSNLHMDVWWNGVYFHKEDHPFRDDVQEQEAYNVVFTWDVPRVAPSGFYEIDLVMQEGGMELGCVRVTLEL